MTAYGSGHVEVPLVPSSKGWFKTFLLYLVTVAPLAALLERADAPLLVRALFVAVYCAAVFWFGEQRGWVRRRERPDPLDPLRPPGND